MKTDDLIDALGAGLEPVGPARLSPAALTLAAAAAVVAVLFLLGLRPDLGAAVQGPAFWAKAPIRARWPSSAAGWCCGWAVRAHRRGRRAWRSPPSSAQPGRRRGRDPALGARRAHGRLAGGHLALLLRQHPEGVRFRCAVHLAFGARTGAHAPVRAGAAMGVLTGAVGATAYGLHCPEATAAFVATWYALGVLLCGAVGALTGRYALRW